MKKKIIVFALAEIFIFIASSIIQTTEGAGIHLRSTYTELTAFQVQQLPHKSIRKVKKWGFFGHSTVNHNYEEKTINGDQVVVDHSTGLTWHQSGSEKHLGWKKVSAWLTDLNEKGYAGYSDWRLPTVEEALTLLESTKNNDGLYIDSVFDKKQKLIWTGDSFKSGDSDVWSIGINRGVWEVRLHKGSVGWMNTTLNFRFVRPLRSGILQRLKGDEVSSAMLQNEKLWLIVEDTEMPPVTDLQKRKIVDVIGAKESNVELRSFYSDLSVSEVQSMPYISIRSDEKWGFYGYSTIKHKYEKSYLNGDNVVIDNATGLMWHQSGSDKYMGWSEAKKWVKRLNNKGYAGHYDWRLPTLEEAATLIEPGERINGLHIDTAFDINQSWIWTGDSCGPDGAWDVEFGNGSVHWSNISDDINYYVVRPVRTVKRRKVLKTDKSKGENRTSSTGINKGVVLERKTYNVFTQKDSNVYHKMNCSVLYNTGNLVEYESPQDAGKAGGLPCNYCNP
ncbi:hypothetical protein SCALIN_C13_0012 [Candidatus Scalindua japonica]|uniref:Lcl C-terminal domain-containing protein n=1 Tax=Candidatus Scalindua japonica TaxID=1284222 RepID=A0A286TXG3_9BACT|nr:DUF1566 domain-containing protein [Candidatus Scalindua japonica]GAX60501.1 hypothetical protein SCALIN_C13_0012 [Candidatus Scalindua japonica]